MHAGRARRARAATAPALTGSRLLNGTHRSCTSSSSASSPSGWAPRRRSSSRPATRPTSARSARCSAPGDTVIADSGDHASILDGCLLSRAKLRPFRHNRLDKLEKMLERAGGRRRRRARGRRRRVLDGGRRRAAAARSSSCARRYGARLMVDEAHGAGVLGARGAGASRAVRRRGPRRPADGHVLEVARLLRRLHRRLARGDRLPADPVARLPVHRRARVPAAVGAALAALRIIRSDEGPPLFARVLENARVPRATGCTTSASSRRVALPTARTTTPIVPVLVGDDWKAVLLWRALYDAGVYVNVALHPAVPPGGALLRTSVMATHDRATLDRALDRVRRGQAALRGRARPAAGPRRVASRRTRSLPRRTSRSRRRARRRGSR